MGRKRGRKAGRTRDIRRLSTRALARYARLRGDPVTNITPPTPQYRINRIIGQMFCEFYARAGNDGTKRQIEAAAQRFIDVVAAENKEFKPHSFLRACGILSEAQYEFCEAATK